MMERTYDDTRNGSEVTASPTFKAMHPERGYLYHMGVISPEHFMQEEENGVYFVLEYEFICQGCGTHVDSPEGHWHDDCDEARRGKNEDRLSERYYT